MRALSKQGMNPLALEHDPEKWIPVFGKDHAQIKILDYDPIQLDHSLGTTMADDTKKTKTDTATKKDTAATVKSPAADTAKAEPKSEAGEAPAKAPSDYSRGEGQKPVTAAYKENWNAIFAKGRTKKKSARKKAR
jgi:hypothetical protein